MKHIIIFLIILLFSIKLVSQIRIEGHVLDSIWKTNVKDVIIYPCQNISNANSTITNNDGQFSFLSDANSNYIFMYNENYVPSLKKIINTNKINEIKIFGKSDFIVSNLQSKFFEKGYDTLTIKGHLDIENDFKSLLFDSKVFVADYPYEATLSNDMSFKIRIPSYVLANQSNKLLSIIIFKENTSLIIDTIGLRNFNYYKPIEIIDTIQFKTSYLIGAAYFAFNKFRTSKGDTNIVKPNSNNNNGKFKPISNKPNISSNKQPNPSFNFVYAPIVFRKDIHYGTKILSEQLIGIESNFSFLFKKNPSMSLFLEKTNSTIFFQSFLKNTNKSQISGEWYIGVNLFQFSFAKHLYVSPCIAFGSDPLNTNSHKATLLLQFATNFVLFTKRTFETSVIAVLSDRLCIANSSTQDNHISSLALGIDIIF